MNTWIRCIKTDYKNIVIKFPSKQFLVLCLDFRPISLFGVVRVRFFVLSQSFPRQRIHISSWSYPHENSAPTQKTPKYLLFLWINLIICKYSWNELGAYTILTKFHKIDTISEWIHQVDKFILQKIKCYWPCLDTRRNWI